MKERTRMNPERRRELILKAALREAEKVGYQNVSRPAVAARADVSVGLVTHYLGTMAKMERAIMREAIRTENARVIAQGILMKHPQARKLTEEQKSAALSAI